MPDFDEYEVCRLISEEAARELEEWRQEIRAEWEDEF